MGRKFKELDFFVTKNFAFESIQVKEQFALFLEIKE